MNNHMLEGCREVPFSNYLKALGVFSALAKRDPDTRAFWKDGSFVIQSSMDRQGLVGHMIREYEPVPILNPLSWSKYESCVKTIQRLLGAGLGKRLDGYEKMLKGMETVCTEFKKIYNLKTITKDSIDKDTKPVLLKLCRNWLPDEVIPMLDAIGVAREDSCTFAPIGGSGLNDGNHDMAENYIKHIEAMLDPEAGEKSGKYLEMALYEDTYGSLDAKTGAIHNANGMGGYNSGPNFEGIAIMNPWDYILMMEGMLMFAGSVSKKLSANAGGRAVFPFTVGASCAGYPAAAIEEKADSTYSRGEIWVPVWSNPASFMEIRHVFGEGRAQIGGRDAKTGADFARAVVTLGTERGISQFRRFCIMKRKGRTYLTVNAGKINVRDVPAAGLLEDVNEWYERLERGSSKNTARLNVLMKNYEDSMMKFCSSGKNSHLLRVLVNIGRLEKYASVTKDAKPLGSLRAEWINECYDRSAEFRLAASLASINDSKTGGIRKNLEHITDDRFGLKYEKSPSCVWNEKAGLLKNMERVLYRRCIDGKIKGCKSVPINGRIRAEKADIRAFLYGMLDEKKIGDLLLPLSMINMNNLDKLPWDVRSDALPLPEAYCVIKALYPPKETEEIPYNISVINSLIAGRTNDAYARASYILHAHGLSTARRSKRTGGPGITTLSRTVSRHLAASLLFPVLERDRSDCMCDVIKQGE